MKRGEILRWDDKRVGRLHLLPQTSLIGLDLDETVCEKLGLFFCFVLFFVLQILSRLLISGHWTSIRLRNIAFILRSLIESLVGTWWALSAAACNLGVEIQPHSCTYYSFSFVPIRLRFEFVKMASDTPTPNSNLPLPPELRDKIFAELLVHPGRVLTLNPSKHKLPSFWRTPDEEDTTYAKQFLIVSQVSKAMRQEVYKIFFGLNE